MNDVFKDMQVKVGCDYLSDLPSYKRKVWQEMKRLNSADYEERQLEGYFSHTKLPSFLNSLLYGNAFLIPGSSRF